MDAARPARGARSTRRAVVAARPRARVAYCAERSPGTITMSGTSAPALAKLMRAYLRAAPGFIVQGGHLQPLLGVFQKLLASKATEAHAFALLCGVLECVPLDAFTQYLPTVFQLALTRMQTNNAARRVAHNDLPRYQRRRRDVRLVALPQQLPGEDGAGVFCWSFPFTVLEVGVLQRPVVFSMTDRPPKFALLRRAPRLEIGRVADLWDYRVDAERDFATAGACAATVPHADVVRVHDVRAAKHALAVADALRR